MESRYLSVDDGTTLHYLCAGVGPEPIVFVHGWCSNSTHFAPQLDHFSRTHRVIAPDRRGHGRSDVPSDGYNPDRHARDLIELFDAEAIDAAVIVGHAGGCPTVLTFAVNHPDRCRALVLLDTRISANVDPEGSGRDSPLAQMVRSIADDETFMSIYRGFISDRDSNLQQRIVDEAFRVPRAVAQADLSSIALDTEALARRVDCPVLWISVDAPDEERLSSLFHDIRFVQCTDSGHFIQLEAADPVNRAIDAFLDAEIAQITRDQGTPERDSPR